VNLSLSVSLFNQADGSEQARIWKPEIREVEVGAILKNDDLLDVEVDAQLLGFGGVAGGQNDGAGAMSAPGQYVPTGPIAGAPAINALSGRETVYEYDNFGNVTKVIDPNGNTVERWYDENSNLTRELSYGSYENSANTSLWSRYVYDANDNLRFAIGADGRVTEYQYGSNGLLAYQITYPEDRYALGSEVPALSEVEQWLNGLDLTTSQINWTKYDARGNVIQNANYTRHADGSTYWAPEGGPTVSTAFTRDQAGQLLTRATGSQIKEVFVYDGLGRVTASTDLAGGTTTIVFDDAASKTVITTASNAVSTSTYSLAGELLSQTNTGDFDETGTATYEYDDMGRLRVMTDETGVTSYYVYDKLGRKTADVNAEGHITEYRYDEAGRLNATASYNQGLVTANLDALANPQNSLQVADIRPNSTPYDVWSWTLYDDAGRILQTIDGEGNVTRFEYDAADRLIKTTGYFNSLSDADLTAFKATSPTTLTLPDPDERDVYTRAFYDRAGNLVGNLDGEGYLTESVYDEAGQLIRTEAFGGATSDPLRASGTFAQLRSSAIGNGTSIRRSYNVYDGLGLLRYAVNTRGEVTGYNYNKAGQVIETVAYATPISTGDYTFDNLALVVQSSPFDRSATNQYNTRGQLESATDASGLTTTFAYDDRGQVTKQVVGSGEDARTTRYWYSSQGNLRYTLDAENYIRRFDYDAEDRLRREITWSGKRVVTDTTTIDQLAGAGSWTDVRYTYDAVGRRNSVYDGEGNRTLSNWHRTGQLAYIKEGYGTVDESESYTVYYGNGSVKYQAQGRGTSDRSDTHYYYDGLGNVSSVRDGNLNSTTYTYDERGLVLTETDAEGGVTTYEYNAFGEVVKVTDARGYSTTTQYDDLGRVTRVTDSLGGTTRYTYTSFGEVETVTDPRGNVTSYTYDKQGRLETSTDALGGQVNYDYNEFGDQVGVTDAGGNETAFTFDKLGRVTSSTDALGFVESYGYDSRSNRTSVTARSETDDIADSEPNVTYYKYDGRNLLIRETMPVSSYNADGTLQSTSVTNTYEYDARGNRTGMTEAAGLLEERTTTYAYDKLDRLIESRGQAREVYSQDSHTRISEDYIPVETIAYDKVGNVTKTVDASGAVTIFYYDDLNRKVVEINAFGTYTAYEYDAAGNVKRIRIFDMPVSVPANAATDANYVGGSKEEAPGAPSNTARETLFDYDALGRLEKSSVVGVHNGFYDTSLTPPAWVANADNFETLYAYDANGNVTKTTDPMGNETFAYYDKLGRKVGQVDALGYYTKWEYDSEGNVLTETQFGNKVSNAIIGLPPSDPAVSEDDRITQYTYDEVGNRLTEKRLGIEVYDYTDNNATPGEDNPGTTITLDGEVSYTYNGLGQVLTKTEATGDAITYTYDDGGRLISESRFGYDQATDQLLTYGYLDHNGAQVTPTANYAYDGLGNLSRTTANAGANERISTYEYNAGGLLSKMKDAAGNSHEYFYDASGRQLVDQYSRTQGGTVHTEAALTSYDLLGRVTEQKVARKIGNSWHVDTQESVTNGTVTSDGTITQTAYNAFGDVVRTGVNGVWISENKYDLAGRMWSTNAGDGVWKFFGYDKNGNQTLAITSAGAQFANSTTFQDAYDGIDDANVNATYTRYDARNMAVEVHEEQRQLNATTTKDLTTTRNYNAFGEVTSETDARGATISYTYNTMGRMIRSESPVVSITNEDGSTQLVRPSEDFYYDLSGRLVAQRDANGVYDVDVVGEDHKLKAKNTGNLTRLELLAGTGYGGTEALITKQIAADG